MSGHSLAAVRGMAGHSQTYQQVLRLVHNASVGLPTTSRAAALWAREFSGAARVGQPIILRRQVRPRILSFKIITWGQLSKTEHISDVGSAGGRRKGEELMW